MPLLAQLRRVVLSPRHVPTLAQVVGDAMHILEKAVPRLRSRSDRAYGVCVLVRRRLHDARGVGDSEGESKAPSGLAFAPLTSMFFLGSTSRRRETLG